MPRRIAMLASLAVIAGSAASSAAKADEPADGTCAAASPTAVACVGAEKLSEGAAAGCRRAGPEDTCATATPAGRDVRTSALGAYADSWLHRAAQYQFRLGDPLPLRDAQWLGTHNSYNANANGPTLSHTDSNQQLTLRQQLDGDIRSLELDVHYVAGALRVCHARGASEGHAGCTTEPTLGEVLPEIEGWLTENPDDVLLLYLEDHIGSAGYGQALTALRSGLPNRIYAPPAKSEKGCTMLPLELSRAQVREAGRQVVLVGRCEAGWSEAVFGWGTSNQIESGNSTGYSCSSPFSAADYASKLVRFFEDGTWLATALAPQEDMAANRARRLTAEKVRAMVDCGVNLFGFDHFDPTDGRVAGSIWSWAENQPDAAAGACAVQGADGRWRSAPCVERRPAACRTSTGWTLSPPVAAAGAAGACRSIGGAFAAPRSGLENAGLRVTAAGTDPWLAAPAYRSCSASSATACASTSRRSTSRSSGESSTT